MAKEKPKDKEDGKREKHIKKEKRSEKDGVHKIKKVKSEKKKNDAAEDRDVTTELVNALESKEPTGTAQDENDEAKVRVKIPPLLGALVPFAHPLADEKVQKKVFKGVKRAAKHRSLKRGVKEVVKSLRKSPSGVAAMSSGGGDASLPHGVVVIAADISPMDVISHIPVLCEDHGVPYVFVPSRAELGAAGNTKRPTSVVMVGMERGGKKKTEEKSEDDKDFGDVYKDLVKVVVKASRDVRI